MSDREIMPIGVFASIGAGPGVSLEVVQQLGLPTVHVLAPRSDLCTEAYAQEVRNEFERARIEITLVFCSYSEESYETIAAVQETVGLAPPTTRDDRIEQTRRTADFAAALGAPGLGIHVGFISEDRGSAQFGELVRALRGLCEYCSAMGLCINLETGQENAVTLLRFLQEVNRANLGVNFDPANMILYGSGEPIRALRKLGAYLRSCHCKDGTWSEKPGEEWGLETPLGEGDVEIETFLSTLIGLGYEGPLTIEREISGEQQARDIGEGVKLLERLKKKLLDRA